MKKLQKILLYILSFLVIGFSGWGIVYALPCVVNGGCTGQSNVPKGTILVGSSTNQSLIEIAPCSNGLVLAASSTSFSGWACVSTSGSSGLTSFQGMTGPAITVATTSDANLLLTIITGNNNATFTPAFTGQLSVARGGTASSTLGTTLVGFATNDTNVTGTILNNNLTLGWSGTLAVARGGTGTNTLASLTSNSSPNLTVTGGQNVLIGTSTSISLGSNVVTTLATGTSGTIFNGSIGSNTLTLNLPFASGSNTGQLQSADWTTFNNKLGSYNVISANNLLSVSTTTNLATLTANESPSFTGTLNVTGTSTLATTTISQLTLGDGISTGCLTNTSGVVSSTGVACGSGGGGSGNSAWTIGNGFIYNATSTDNVEIGFASSTPAYPLVISTKATTSPVIAILNTDGSVGLEIRAGGGGVADNTFVGLNAGKSNLSTDNSFFGSEVGKFNTSGGANTFMGSGAGMNTTGSYNTGYGNGALSGNGSSAGTGNTAIGNQSMQYITSGGYNVGLGYYSGYNIGSGSSNVFIGLDSGFNQANVSNGLWVGNIYQSTAADENAYSLLYGKFAGSAATRSGQFLDTNGVFNVNTTTLASVVTIQATSSASTVPLLTVASSSGATILSVTPASGTYNLIQAGTTTAPNLFVVDSLGNVFLNHLVGSSTLPTIATSTGDGATAGTATITANGTDLGFQVTETTGNAPAANKIIWTATFSRAFTTAPICSDTSNTSTPAFIEDTYLINSATSTSLWSSTTALTGTSTYQSSIICVGTLGG